MIELTIKAIWLVKQWLKGTTMKANEQQVGGEHYRKHNPDYQHWDWVVNVDMHYLLAASSKYLCRWRDKGTPLEDLRKAAHYLDKMIEVCPMVVRNRMNMDMDWCVSETNRFLDLNKIPNSEAYICIKFATWRSRSTLEQARLSLAVLIEDYHNNESIAVAE